MRQTPTPPTPVVPERRFNIHGDNIVECERALELLAEAAGVDPDAITGPLVSAAVPEFWLDTPDCRRWAVTLFPGFGRWEPNIVEHLRTQGGVLREAPDAIVTEVGEHERILFAIEFCSALDAGNQAWQRHGRAYSLAQAGIPYLYVTELGGYELDRTRRKKAVRVPNPAVPFSYASYTQLSGVPSLPVFVPNAAAAAEGQPHGSDVYGREDAVQFVVRTLSQDDPVEATNRLLARTMTLVRQLAANRTRRDSLNPEQWDKARRLISQSEGLVRYLVDDVSMDWKKTATIDALTESAAALMGIAGDLGVGLTSSNLPLCIVPAAVRQHFAEAVARVHPDLPEPFLRWLAHPENLVIAWVMGFKPGGDDARPDRGLPPFARMLAGDAVHLLTVVYGPATPDTWPLLHEAPRALMDRNGLWEVILGLSDAVLVDSATDSGITDKGYLSEHWDGTRIAEEPVPILVAGVPTKLTENDVDTALHVVLGRLLESLSFEGLCNPPGGDWSGLSVLGSDASVEFRWLSLPRVSGTGTKRPDHVFQIFRADASPVLLVIESKEQAARLSAHIGPRLLAYVTDLFCSPPDVRRSHPDGVWESAGAPSSAGAFEYCSAVAFLGATPDPLNTFCKKTGADLVIEVHFSEDGRTCDLVLRPCTEIGGVVAGILSDIVEHDLYSIQ